MRAILRLFALGIPYAILAALAMQSSRFDHGLASFWIASAYLTAVLSSLPRKEWAWIVTSSMLFNIFLTGTIGLGWGSAIPISATNMVEALVGACLIRRRIAATTMESLDWFARYVLKIGAIAPAIGATMGCLVLYQTTSAPIIASWATWFVGHSLGGIVFTPMFLLVIRGDARKSLKAIDREALGEVLVLMGLFVASCVFTFGQSRWPLLFFPLGPLSLICFRLDRTMVALAIALLAIVGATFTASGTGPISLMDVEAEEKVQFFQFYLMAIVFTVLPVMADLQSRQRLLRKVRTREKQFQLLLENSTDAVFHLKPSGAVIFASPSVEALSGKKPSDLVGKNALMLVEEDWRDYVAECHADVLRAGGKSVRYEYLARTANGASRWFETLSQAIPSPAGEVESVVSVVRDIDERKRSEITLVREARIDALTGLMNRHGFQQQFDQLDDKSSHCIAVVDIDHFKAINDRYGHAAGDRALQTFADIALRSVRKRDLVARFGGEEFVLLLTDMKYDDAYQVCERLRAEIASAITIFGAECIRFTVSIGLAETTEGHLASDLRRADIALYQAKSEGRDCLRRAA